MQPTSATWRMADQLAGGKLERELRRLQRKGLGSRSIAEQLYRDHGVLVSHATIATWLHTLDLERVAS